MVVRIRKKISRQRGSKTHGCGSKKKARGSGNRGGTGMAGTGKRAQQKKPTILKYFPDYFGKHGFNSIRRIESNVINIKDLPSKEEVNLTDLGYDKLLSQGTPKIKYKITVSSCSPKAKEKIEKAGGSVATQ